MPAAVAVAVAVAISVLGGLVADYTLDFFRICGLLPFFVLGLTTTPEVLERLRAGWARRTAPVVFAGVLALTWSIDAIGGKDWLYYSYPYSHFAVSTTQALLVRTGLLVVGGLGGLAFLALVPRRTGWFTRMGAATLVVYLFHGFVVKSFEYAGWPGWADAHQAASLLVTTAGAAGLAMLLATPPVASRLTHLVDPFGYARRHVDRAVALTGAHAEAEVIAEAIEQAAEPEALATR
jgi:fucose 4-O-acetylase-like acetyltransferase